ncbi:D-glucuronyl C5-epimerase family protein [Aeromonas dhakensis]|uniref:D-glucuronyl C5-epimerase family protein n=1 Tax=Aeromonas dhakensis TaxID=196024 RepID=UPI003987CFD1
MKIFNKSVEILEHTGRTYIDTDDVAIIFSLIKDNQGNYKYFDPIYNLQEYSYIDDYLGFSRLSVPNWKIVEMDPDGIPINKYNGTLHYYPITIAHYGLELFGKYINGNKKKTLIYMGEDLPYTVYESIDGNDKCIDVDSTISTGIELINTNSVPLADIEIRNSKKDYRIYISCSNGVTEEQYCIYPGKNKIDGKLHYVSSIENIPLANKKDTTKNILVRGSCSISYKMPRSEEIDKIINIAEWFIANQSTDGSWPSHFEHMFYKGRTATMPSGWVSALAQGLTISFLCRAYQVTKDDRYLNSAKYGLKPYYKHVSEGGILTYWDSEYEFYEEYPTKPSSFVLNGFIFSILGLYDLSCHGDNDALHKFNLSIRTLEKMLPLYDLGDKTAYDLTHYSCGTYPNIARWAYHTTHVNQLNAIYSITKSEMIKSFFERWKSYLDDGYSCPTN